MQMPKISILNIRGFFLCALVCTGAAQAADSAGKILLVKGNVFILDAKSNVVADPEGKRGRKTKVGSDFFVGETLQTKGEARVKLKFIEGGNEVTLGGDTSLLIERASNNKGVPGTTLNLARGEVRSDVKIKYSGENGSNFEVKTKTAVAGVRGTVFTLTHDQKNGTRIFTSEGGVLFSSTKNGIASAVLVTRGNASAVSVGGAVAPPAPPPPGSEIAKIAESLSGKSDSSSQADGGSGSSAGDGKQPASADGKSEPGQNDGQGGGNSQDSNSESGRGDGGSGNGSGSNANTSADNGSGNGSGGGGSAVALGREPSAPPSGTNGPSPASGPGGGFGGPGAGAPPPPGALMGQSPGSGAAGNGGGGRPTPPPMPGYSGGGAPTINPGGLLNNFGGGGGAALTPPNQGSQNAPVRVKIE